MAVRFYRWPGLLGLAVFGLSFVYFWDRYWRYDFEYRVDPVLLDQVATTAFFALISGAIVYAVASLTLLAWRKSRGRPLSGPPRRSWVDHHRDRPGWR